MAQVSWGQGSSAETSTGILDVLLAFVSQGGWLYGARRWEDNPLTLTHVRWQGTSGGVLDAFRRPGGTVGEDDVESAVWVQLALNFPSAHPSAAGADAPWLQLTVDPATASQWVAQLRQSNLQRRAHAPTLRPPYSTLDSSLPVLGPRTPEELGNPWHRPNEPGIGYGNYNPYSPYGKSPVGPSSPDHEPSPFTPLADTPSPERNPHNTSMGPEANDPGQWTGEFQRSSAEGTEIAVLPCIEIELPPLLGNRTAMDYHRDFARDVAIHFRQAVQQFREVREVRGWMRGERLVLAARFILKTGTRTPKQTEMDQVAQRLADALTERTLPYAYLGFADPGEWMQGRPLPES
ncbi:MAG: hypothetical protein ACLQUY_17775 [Ktedonobacterales bacterium]